MCADSNAAAPVTSTRARFVTGDADLVTDLGDRARSDSGRLKAAMERSA